MSLDAIRNLHQPAPTRDEFDEIKQKSIRRYVSPWVRLDAGASIILSHGLGEIPMVVSVLDATDSQGAEAAVADDVTVTSTRAEVVVVNSGSARFFRVRAL